MSLSGALSAPSSLKISPANVTLLIGETHQFTAVDQLGHPRPDTTWTISDTTFASITTDSSPLLTGVAAGTVTLTATVQRVSAQVQVNILGGSASLAPGTVTRTQVI